MADINGTSGPDMIDGTEGPDSLNGLAGNDNLDGKGGNDRLFAGGGFDLLLGGSGDDELFFGSDFTSADYANGGDGTVDALILQGNYNTLLTFGSGQLYDIERLELLPGNDGRFGEISPQFFSFRLATADGNVVAGRVLTVDASKLRHSDFLSFDGSAELDGSFVVLGGATFNDITGGAGNDSLTGAALNDRLVGNAGNDVIVAGAGGNDTVVGGAGDDQLYFGASLTNGDYADGTDGQDTLVLQGNYNLGLRAGVLQNVEAIELLSGNDARFGANGAALHSYTLTLNDKIVAGGQTMAINASGLRAGETLMFDGTTETDGRFVVSGGASADQITGGSGDDVIAGGAGGDRLFGAEGDDLLIAGSGNDLLVGNGGDDRFYLGADLTNGDYINGGTGNDALYLQGNYASLLVVGSGVLLNVETIVLMSGSNPYFGDTAGNTLSYNLRTSDENVASGQTLTVDLSGLGSQEHVIFGGAAETNGSFIFYGGLGDDTLVGGANNDVFNFGMGRWDQVDDTVNGGAGSDTLNIQLAAGTNALNFRPNQLGSIETLNLLGAQIAGTHTVTLQSGNIAKGGMMTVDTSSWAAGEKLVFNASAIGDARVTVNGTQNDDWIRGSAGNDILLGGLGSDTIIAGTGMDSLGGGPGDDIFYMGANLTNADYVSGREGYDRLILQGSGTYSLQSNVVVGIDKIDILSASDASYGGPTASSSTVQIVLSDSFLPAGQSLVVDGRAMGASDTLDFNGSPLRDGNLTVYGGAGNDIFTGSADRAATFWGGGGADTFKMGMRGTNTYVYASVEDSTPAAADLISLWYGGKIDLSRIDANVATPEDDPFHFIGNAVFSNVAGELRVTSSTTFVGGLNGQSRYENAIIEGDVNGDGIADFQLHTSSFGDAFFAPLVPSGGNFIL